MAKIEGKTSSGFDFAIEESVFDDMELLDDLADIDRGNIAAVSSALTRVLGSDGKKALYEHCRGANGVVPVTRIGQELTDIFTASGTGKK